MGFCDSSVGRESTCSAGDLGLTLGLGRSPGEGKGCSCQYSGEFHGLCSQWDHKESNMIERLSLSLFRGYLLSLSQSLFFHLQSQMLSSYFSL